MRHKTHTILINFPQTQKKNSLTKFQYRLAKIFQFTDQNWQYPLNREHILFHFALQ